ncbi:MAG: SAM hydrolase/SAM-dependent halogenase family protein [Microthrixaceae bacterium]
MGPPRYDTVSFLSDYGRTDEFVGVVHSVIRQLAPGVGVVDVTHDIPPFDVRAGGLALARSAPYLCPGVVLAVVDPGVGTARRAVAVEVGGGTAVLVGPDNGLLAPAVALVGGATRAVVLDNPEYHLEGRALFDGRDVFGPAAAYLCQGIALEELGTEIDPAGMVPGLMPVAREEDGSVVAEVLWVDRYGNAQLNVDPDELDPFGSRFELKVTAGRWTGVRADAFAGVVPGTVGMVTDSSGLLALVGDRSSAAEELGLAAGDEVVVTPIQGEVEDAPAVEVRLGRRPDDGGRS